MEAAGDEIEAALLHPCLKNAANTSVLKVGPKNRVKSSTLHLILEKRPKYPCFLSRQVQSKNNSCGQIWKSMLKHAVHNM